MGIGQEIGLLDDVAAGLRAMASSAAAYDPEILRWMADQVERAADRAQEVADLRAALALLAQPHTQPAGRRARLIRHLRGVCVM
jgi:hypothetical protein